MPEVTFHVSPKSVVVDYQAAVASAREQSLPLGDTDQPLELKDEFFRGGRDNFTLIFRDPNGDFKSETRVFGKFEFKPGRNVWPPEGRLWLQPVTLRGYLQRYFWLLTAAATLLVAVGTFAMRRAHASRRAAKSEKDALISQKWAKAAALREEEAARAAEARAVLEREEAERQKLDAQEQAARALEAEKAAADSQQKLEASRGDDPLVDLKLEGYHVRQLLGKGAMGRVYRAEASEEKIPPVVAIKFVEIMPEHDLARIENELLTHRELKHPNIVECFGGGLYKGYAYLLLELVEGGRTLQSWIVPGGSPAPKVISALKPVFAALYHAHTHKPQVVHRDLKPDNIMLTREGVPKVADFGYAKQENVNLTKSGAVLGTLPYMSPEQGFSSKEAVPNSDQYSLGIMLFQMLTGELPFQQTDVVQLIMAHYQEPPPPLPPRPDLPAELNEALQRMLAKEPGQRFPDLLSCYRALAHAVGA